MKMPLMSPKMAEVHGNRALPWAGACTRPVAGSHDGVRRGTSIRMSGGNGLRLASTAVAIVRSRPQPSIAASPWTARAIRHSGSPGMQSRQTWGRMSWMVQAVHCPTTPDKARQRTPAQAMPLPEALIKASGMRAMSSSSSRVKRGQLSSQAQQAPQAWQSKAPGARGVDVAREKSILLEMK